MKISTRSFSNLSPATHAMTTRITTNLTRFFMLGLSAALLSTSVYALSNPGIPGNSGGCESSGSGGGSFHAFFDIGDTRYQKGDLLKLARAPVGEGQQLGKMPRSFDEMFSATYTQNVSSGLQTLQITVQTLELDASILQPSSLKMDRSTSSEVIEKNGAIRQVLTSNTLVDILPRLIGYHIKVYDRAVAGAKDSNGLYTIAANQIPLKENIVRTPGDVPFADTIDLIFIDRKNPAPRAVIERFIRSQNPDTLTQETYAATFDGNGAALMGSLQEREVITYSNRGARRYDYTLLRETQRVSTAADGSQGPLVLVARRQEVYKDFTPVSANALGGDSIYKRLLSETDGFGTAQARATTYTWYETANLQIHGRLMSRVAPDGGWEYYEYTDSGGVAAVEQRKYSSWLDVTMANRAQARFEKTSVNSTTGYTKQISIGGVLLSTEEFATLPGVGGEINTLTLRNSANTVLSRRVWQLHPETAAAEKAGRIAWMENPDGTAETYSYTAGSGSNDGSFTLSHRKGAGNRDGVTLGTETVTTYNKFIKASSESKKDIASGLMLDFWLAPTVDVTGRPTRIEYNGDPNDYETFQYACCGLERKRSRDGSVSVYSRDALKRIYRMDAYRYDADPAPISNATAYSGLTTTTTRGGILQSEITIGLNGETVGKKSPDSDGDGLAEVSSMVTAMSATTGKTVTTTQPDLSTVIEKTYLDGQQKSAEGTAVADTFYQYALVSLGSENALRTQTFRSTASSAEWEKTYTDALGRIVKIEFPATAPATAIPTLNYAYFPSTASLGSATQLQSMTDADGKMVSYSYNSEGERTTTTEQVSAGQLRITAVQNSVVSVPNQGNFRQTQTRLNGTLISTQQHSANGHTTIVTDLSGTTTTVKSIADAAGNSTITTTQPDGTQQVRTIIGNLVSQEAQLSTTGAPITATSYTYDALHRIETSTDARTVVASLNRLKMSRRTATSATSRSAIVARHSAVIAW